jgi:hypothetical protein
MLLLDTDIHLFGEGGELQRRDHAEQVNIGMGIDSLSILAGPNTKWMESLL